MRPCLHWPSVKTKTNRTKLNLTLTPSFHLNPPFPMKPILFSLLLLPLALPAQVGIPFTWSDPIYTYDASGNRVERFRTQGQGPGSLRQADPAWQLTLGPNPSDGVFLLRSSVELEGAELHVYDLSGRSVLRQPMRGAALKLDLRQQPAGVYVFRVRRGTDVWEEKGVKQ